MSECSHPRELHFLRERASPHPQEETVCGLKAFSPQQFPSLGLKQQERKSSLGHREPGATLKEGSPPADQVQQ